MLFLRKHTYLILGLVVGLVLSLVILIQRNQPHQERRTQHVKRKTHPQTPHPSQNKSIVAHRNKTYTYSHTHDNNSSIRQERISEEDAEKLTQLRDQYRDKVIGTRQWNSKYAGLQREKLYPEEYYEKELEILCGEMTPEQAADYLESVRRFSRALLKRLDTVSAYRHLKTLGYDRPEVREYAERVIAENPGTEIEFEARYYIAREIIPSSAEFHAEKVAAYQAVLEIDPNFQGALSGIGVFLVDNDKPAEAIPYLKKHNSVAVPGRGYPADAWLGRAYEKLGDVKTAWIYYKRALAGSFYQENEPEAVSMRHHIERIEVGNPIYKPVLSAREPVSIDSHVHEHIQESDLPQEHIHHTEVFPDDRPFAEPDSAIPSDIRAENVEKRRVAAKAAQQAYDDLQKHQEHTQKELKDFLQWTATIMNAESPMNTNNFLMKEMEAHLKRGQPQFEPERIIRGFEIMERYGAADGIKRLQKVDPDLAKQVQRLLSEKGTHQQHQ